MRPKDEILGSVLLQDNNESVEHYTARILKRILEVLIDLRDKNTMFVKTSSTENIGPGQSLKK